MTFKERDDIWSLIIYNVIFKYSIKAVVVTVVTEPSQLPVDQTVLVTPCDPLVTSRCEENIS